MEISSAKVLLSLGIHSTDKTILGKRQNQKSSWVAAIHDEEGAVAPRYIQAWTLPQEDIDGLMAEGAGAAPDIIYTRGVPADPSLDFEDFNRMNCTLILFEVGFCRDLDCHQKYTDKTDKYLLLLTALQTYWGRVDFVCIPIGHAGTTLTDTVHDFASALAKVRPSIASERKRKGRTTPDTSSAAPFTTRGSQRTSSTNSAP